MATVGVKGHISIRPLGEGLMYPHHQHHHMIRLTWCKRKALQEHATKSKISLCYQCQTVPENRQVFIVVQNDETVGAAVTKRSMPG